MKETIKITSRGQSMTAEVYTPTGEMASGVVIIAYGSDGLTDDLNGPWATMIQEYADALVKNGFTTIIPDYLAITSTSPGPDVFPQIPNHRDTWQEAIADTIDHAKTLAGVDAERVGLLGFSLGGHLCLRLRAKANVLEAFFSPVLDGIGQANGGILTHAQIHHGEADRLPGTGYTLNAVPIANTLKGEGAATELFSYPGAGHGFIGGDTNNTKARTLSKQRTLSFFQSRL